MCSALKDFYDCNKRLPVSGLVPDMTALTNYYLDLKQIYSKKADQDLVEMREKLLNVVKSRGVPNHQEIIESIDEDLRRFCKNAFKNLEVTQLKSLEQELGSERLEVDDPGFKWMIHDPESSCHTWYVVSRAVEKFRNNHGYLPGLKADDLQV